ncbi:Uncharacterized protein SHERM_08403 [Striga hermonthica]|uniref:Intracellular protein transporter USO1-like protein n=1 Tax=Striga hermonthica TaxID=68872 RepID=A0A9N7P1M2_STRHE|nr:Uncharacterized protein SHERM_08403 [Striga hermonthica]
MEREEKVKEDERERGELMSEKLKLGILVGKREGYSTPSPTWKFGSSQEAIDSRNTLSARQLGANLWEMQAQLNLRADDKMSTKSGPSLSHPKQDDVFGTQEAISPSKQPTNGISLRKQLKQSSAAQHNLRVEKVGQAQTPLSPASYCSSMEMAPHRATLSPHGSLTPNGKFKDSAHGVKTSTELLKVLNRIWTLEEKHALDMSLVKTLKRELGQAQARIQELLQDKKRDQNEIGTLTAGIKELKAIRKNDQDRTKDEKLHLQLASELSALKLSFSHVMNELEREKRARALLEDLCDEFAKGIRNYEREVRLVKQNSGDQILHEGQNDRFILHISEAWLDERAQSKLEDDREKFSEKQSPLDKLCPEIEAFLREKKIGRKNLETNGGGTYILNGPTRREGHFGNLAAKRDMTDLEMHRKSDTMRRSVREGRHSMKGTNFEREGTKRNSCYNFVEGPFDPAMFTGPSSPVKKWVSMVSAAGPNAGESSSMRWSKGVKPNTLKAKLIEARLEGRQSRARISRSSSRGD